MAFPPQIPSDNDGDEAPVSAQKETVRRPPPPKKKPAMKRKYVMGRKPTANMPPNAAGSMNC